MKISLAIWPLVGPKLGKQQVLQSPVLTVTALESKAPGVSLAVTCSGCGSVTGKEERRSINNDDSIWSPAPFL